MYEDDSLMISYKGDELMGTCKVTVNLNDVTDKICVSFQQFDIQTSSDIKVEFHTYIYTSNADRVSSRPKQGHSFITLFLCPQYKV